MTEIKVGDVVLYQKPSYTNPDGKSYLPMGLSGCRVTAISNDFVCLEWQGFYDKDGPATFEGIPRAYLTKEA